MAHLKKVGIRGTVGLFIPAALAAMILLDICGGVVDSLPRSVSSQSVSAPFSLCVMASLCISLLIPWFAAGMFIQTPKLRILFLAGLAAMVAVYWFGFGFSRTMFKVYFWGGG